MLVCHCHAVNDQTIRQVVKSGARTCRQVGRACAAGGNCGGCRPVIREIIDEEHAQAHTASGDVRVAAS